MRSLQKYYNELQEREKTLAGILGALKTGYNPNYHDMAVLEAVRGWDTYSGERTDSADTQKIGSDAVTPLDESLESEESIWTEDQIRHELDALLDQDYQSLLVQNEEHIARESDESASISELSSVLISVT